MKHHSLRVLCVSLSCAGLLSACYRYTPAELNSLDSAARVRARITPAEAVRLRMDNIMARDLSTIEGRVLELPGDSLRLLVSFVSPYDRTTLGGQEDERALVISRNAIVELQRKQLDRTKTGIAIGIGAAAFTAIIVKTFTGWFSGNNQGKDPDPIDFPETTVVPAVSLWRR